MKTKPKLSFWQIWNMSFGFLGIQFGFALQNANVSRIFETLGAKIDDIPILWIAAPVTGLIIQPIIGHASDKTWCKLGRRRPYFLAGALLASIALFIMPNSPALWIAAGMLWMMDASINVSMEPFRAFVGDMLPSEQRTTGFAMQSFFIGTGAVIASLLPYMMANWFGISNTAPEGIIPPSVKFSFYIGGAIFISAVAWTVFRTKEYSPEELKKFDDHHEDVCETDVEKNNKFQILKSVKLGVIFTILGILLSIAFYFIKVEKEVYILSLGLFIFGILELLSGFLQKSKNKGGFVSVFNDLNAMPKTMGQLAIVQFFSWFALFAMWIYTTNGVTADKYNMKVDSEMVNFLKIELSNNQANNEEEKKKIKDISQELANYEAKILEKESVSANVNLVKFFLNNRIYNETELINEMRANLASFPSNEKDYQAALKELNDLSSVKEPDISFKTTTYINKFLKEAPINRSVSSIEKFSKYTRLKEIREEYNEGANWVGVCFGVYNGFAALFAFLLIWLAKKTSRKITHSISLLVGGLSFISIFFIKEPDMLLLPFVGIGLTWASILAMPYAILTGALPSNKMGVYMGIFNFFIVIPQILAASILGFLVKSIFKEEAIYALILGGISLIIASVLVTFVKDEN